MRSLSFLFLSLALACVSSSSSSVSADEGALSLSMPQMMESSQPNLYSPSLPPAESSFPESSSLPLEQQPLSEMDQLFASPSKKVHLPPLAPKQPEYQELPSKTLSPIFTKPIINTHIETQKIYAPRKIHQPVIQERLIEKPIIQRRMVYQPVIRRIVNQKVIQPKLIQTTELEKQVEERRVIQPRILQQNVVVQQLQKEVENRKATVNEATITALPPTKRPTRVLGEGEGMDMMQQPQEEMMMVGQQQYPPSNEMMETQAMDMDEIEANHHSSSHFEIEGMEEEPEDVDFETEGAKFGGFGGFGYGGGLGFGGFGFPGFGFGLGFGYPGFGFW